MTHPETFSPALECKKDKQRKNNLEAAKHDLVQPVKTGCTRSLKESIFFQMEYLFTGIHSAKSNKD